MASAHNLLEEEEDDRSSSGVHSVSFALLYGNNAGALLRLERANFPRADEEYRQLNKSAPSGEEAS